MAYKYRGSCVPSDVGKKTALVNCHIEDISLQATSLPGDMKNLPKVLEDLDAKLSGASLQLELSMDGRVRSLILRASIRTSSPYGNRGNHATRVGACHCPT